MAAGPNIFSGRLRFLLDNSPLQGPICLTFSKADRANCYWHRIAEGCRGIGCRGSAAPEDLIQTIQLRPAGEDYTNEELRARILNVDAGWRYKGSALSPQGAHSDLWYEESIHLLLTLVNYAR
jgi:hypothetical protein